MEVSYRMKNYYLHFNDLPRTLSAPLPLSALLSSDNALGTWDGKRGNILEFAIRLSSTDAYSVDIQDGRETRMAFPHVYLKYPGSDFHSPPFARREAFAVLYDGALCGRLEEHGILLDTVAWPLEITLEIRSLIRKIDTLCESMSVPGCIDRIDGYALCLLRELMLQHPARRTLRSSESESFYAEKIQRIASYLRAHYAERIRLDELAANHGLSRRTFFRYWKREFPSHSPVQYLLELRMREACRLLRYEMPVSEIALRLNFSDSSCFAELFRRRFGETPTQFRRRRSGKT